MVVVGVAWWPSHQFFTLLRKKHHSSNVVVLSIVGCLSLTILLTLLGVWIGRHIDNPSIRSLGSEAAGSPSTVNLFWAPFALLSLGIWAGFLSGYWKMRIFPERWDKHA